MTDDSTPNSHINFDDLGRKFPSFHRKADGTPWFLGISGATLKEFASKLQPGMRTVETGAGYSSLAFILKNTYHTAICPDDYLEGNIRDWCLAMNVDASRFKYIMAKSQDCLPDITGEIDFAFIDGDHAFPIPVIDFYYLSRLVKVGGYIAVDDINIWTGDILAKYLASSVEWKMIGEYDDKTVLFQRVLPHSDKSLLDQPFVLLNSRKLPTAWLEKFSA